MNLDDLKRLLKENPKALEYALERTGSSIEGYVWEVLVRLRDLSVVQFGVVQLGTWASASLRFTADSGLKIERR